ncbi:OmpA family protein [Burkholderia pseudomallei]|uniref:Chemotaxis LafU protein n=1 Tax=Burkholderia pseudomallei TaxID=28450 RepID=A3FII8_BURPE|nr:flagellar motor protein MotB [Burkholderia pseudomallei]ABN48672.1 chemotaxis LafU protein [Burkholderia pseudomallei]AGR69751.1 membrane MotB of proton-channel complex MotA/MotB family protein [Burkholderia pseudomallei MSHR305]AGZ30530.1 ompA family protein [Burkholderia pseudomallei NCTC 13179]AHE29872.1 ompA family protein [Burkholderia pseudomallei NCTC 13178]AHE36041.1 ompA family protein [Burkholderia pseudomallei NAU20B-16]
MSTNKESGHGPTIIRRAHKRHEEHSGGAWKVAFADFTLALMALFMVLWVMNVTPEKERKQVAAEIAGRPFFDGGVGIFEQRSRKPVVAPFDAQQPDRMRRRTSGAARERTIDSLQQRRALAARIMDEASRLGMDGNVATAINDDGVRITIHDSDKQGMFERRSDALNPPFIRLLTALVPVLGTVTNKMVIVGHTDATQYADASVFSNNWNLSSRRALRARQVLADGGMDAQRMFQISGMGDSVPAVPDNPNHDMNRRVELLLLTSRAEDTWRRLFRSEDVDVRPSADGIGLTVGQAQPGADRPAFASEPVR